MTNTIDVLVNYITKGDDKTKAALTDLAKVMGTVGAAVAAAKAIYEATVGPTIEYAKQIENMAAVTQTGAEETSKLIQVADDARIEYGTLKAAMKELVKNGIAPNIKNLGSLADTYVGIQDPVKRTQFLMENFGSKAGPEMAKLLEQGSKALYDNAAAAEKVGLVMGEEALQAAKDYQASLDSLNDTIEGTKVKLGTAMIPALDDALNGTMNFVGGVILLREALISAVNPFDDVDKALEKQAKEYYAYQTAVEMTDLDIAKLTDNVDIAGASFDQYNMAIQNTQKATEDYALAQIKARQETEALFNSINTNLDQTIAKWLEDLEWMQSGGLELQAQFEAIKKAFIENPQDPDIKKQMEELYVQTLALQVELGKIDSTAAAENIASKLGVSINDAYVLLATLREDTGKPIGLTVNVSYNDPGFSPGGPPQDSGQPKKKPEMDAFGGGVMAGNEYLVGERGPELFRPAVPGTVIPNNITQNYFNLSMTSQQSTGSLQRDFGVMAAFGRA